MSVNELAKFALERITTFEEYHTNEIQHLVKLEIERQEEERKIKKMQKYKYFLQNPNE